MEIRKQFHESPQIAEDATTPSEARCDRQYDRALKHILALRSHSPANPSTNIAA